MRLYLAVAVLMLAFVAYTEAQDAEPTVRERISQLGQTVADGVKSAVEHIKTSDFTTRTKYLLDQVVEIVKTKYTELTQ